MKIFTIYDSPSDYPGLFVVREFVVEVDGQVRAGEVLAVAQRLDRARSFIPPDYVSVGRAPSDPPQIVESYL